MEKLKCECSQCVSEQNLKAHCAKCPHMQLKYSKYIQSFLETDRSTPQQLQNLLTLLHSFQLDLKLEID